MLNDVLSLCVGLWAVRIANRESSKMYTYGWQRAETLGALINGVFLIALCLSIFLEAIQRFVTPQTVSNPKLVLIVGCFGLASNILGLFLFQEHGHSHGDENGDSHEHDLVSNAEEGHSHSHILSPEHTGTDMTDASSPQKTTEALHTRRSTDFRRHRRTSGSFVDAIHIHPASFRNDIIAAGRLKEQIESEPEEEAILDDEITAVSPNERSSLVKHSNGLPKKYTHGRSDSHASLKKKRQDHRHDSWHAAHNHSKPKDESAKEGHGHSHGDLNMRGVFLHVVGDALGNIGVIASALFIWLTSYKWRFYADPAISLVITVIILASAIPLCKAASRILLQAVPTGMSVDEIKEDIEGLPRVISAHHLHVWQLSNTRLIASLHVRVDCDIHSSGSAQYMHLATQIRQCLHGYGIHSSTIQPEFCLPSEEQSPKPGSSTTAANNSGQASPTADDSCLLACGDDCADKNQCCPVTGKDQQ
jgi:solute carrier family 30 (zinc transporter), member 1